MPVVFYEGRSPPPPPTLPCPLVDAQLHSDVDDWLTTKVQAPWTMMIPFSVRMIFFVVEVVHRRHLQCPETFYVVIVEGII